MTEEQINKLADIVASKVVEKLESKQKEWDNEFHVDFVEFVSDNTSYVSLAKQDQQFLLNEKLIEQEVLLHKALSDENYNECANIREKIKSIKNKLLNL
jgi:DNA-dependent RNA polymerase auxiliary subunit epsilon